MTYSLVSIEQVLAADAGRAYILTPVTEDTPIKELRNAHAFVLKNPTEKEEPIVIKHVAEPEATAENELSENSEGGVQGSTEPKKQSKENAAKNAAKKVDHGKLMALYNAGWKVAKIADELNITEQTVYNHLAQEQKKEN